MLTLSPWSAGALSARNVLKVFGVVLCVIYLGSLKKSYFWPHSGLLGSCYVMLCYVVLCYVVSCCVMLCYLFYVM